MLVKIATKAVVSIVRATAKEAASIYRVASRAGYSVEVSPDWRSGEALKDCAMAYDIAAHSEAGLYIPMDEQNAKAKEYASREKVTLAQVEAAFNQLMA